MRKKIITALIMAAIILSAFVFCLAACKDTEEILPPAKTPRKRAIPFPIPFR